ncbi:MAG: phosphate regulon transcriptional regulator PhoB [Gammaproteobacteria bacterium]|nr:phosphate regulon transcriptional regulator PhoB [Gammaproteobacteria bacterium]MDH5730979.1 phosphate regulon transcriptional regulator PhoB [Gammaproteobacteria bacterium]
MLILIIEDERSIREMIALALNNEGYQYLEASDAHKADSILKEQHPDLILLDWMLPGISGVDFARRLRRQDHTLNIPIIMLTAKTEEQDMVIALDSGVDDYLTKPFSTKELLARIRSLMRRTNKNLSTEQISVANLKIDLQAHRVSASGQAIDLGPTEFKLLVFFMQHPDRVFSREQILNQVWGHQTFVEERTVDVHIRRLRKALQTSGHENLVQTVRGSGYRFSASH